MQVLAELAQDKSMDAFRGEYEKLFNALEKSHKNEKRLNTKCQELGSEIASKQARVDAALDKTGEDQDTIGSLRKEIEKAWKMVDMTQVLPLTSTNILLKRIFSKDCMVIPKPQVKVTSKQKNGTHDKTPVSDIVFHALAISVVCFVPTDSSRNSEPETVSGQKFLLAFLCF